MDRSFFRFVTIHAFDRQTDRLTDRRTSFSSLVRPGISCSAEKNYETETETETSMINSIARESKTNRYALLSVTYLKQYIMNNERW